MEGGGGSELQVTVTERERESNHVGFELTTLPFMDFHGFDIASN